MTGLLDTYCGFSMSETAENVAAENGVTRKDSDEYALRSQQAAEAAVQAGKMKEEIVPVEVKVGRRQNCSAPTITAGRRLRLKRLRSFLRHFVRRNRHSWQRQRNCRRRRGCCGDSTQKTAKIRGWKPVGRIVSWATVGVRTANHGDRARTSFAEKHECGRPELGESIASK